MLVEGTLRMGLPEETVTIVQQRSVIQANEAGTSRNPNIPRASSPLMPYQQIHTERIIINGDYLVEGTDTGSWNVIWYVNTKL